jgi:hypothetical protein
MKNALFSFCSCIDGRLSSIGSTRGNLRVLVPDALGNDCERAVRTSSSRSEDAKAGASEKWSALNVLRASPSRMTLPVTYQSQHRGE